MSILSEKAIETSLVHNFETFEEILSMRYKMYECQRSNL